MVLTLDLPQELESELATRLGFSLQEYALRLLSSGRVVGGTPKTGAELVEYWRRNGLIGTRPDITDSQLHARAIRERAERRVRS